VIGPPESLDEYESYVGATLRLLERRASEPELVAYLRSACARMDLAAPEPERFAAELTRWYSETWPDTYA
jgi:hypothetical protein